MSYASLKVAALGMLDTVIFRLGATPLTFGTLLTAIALAMMTFVAARGVRRFLLRILELRRVDTRSSAIVMVRLVYYALLGIGYSVSLQTIGVDLGALFAAGAVFAVGLGFAMQNIAQNFVSGVILLVERTIRPGDIIEVGEKVVKVLDIHIRSTVVHTRDDEQVIVPNSTLVQSNVKNFTLHDSHYRVRTEVGVSYSTDMERVVTVLDQVGRDRPWRVPEKDPIVHMREFGDSAVVFQLSVWCNDPWRSRRFQSDLNMGIWLAFKREGVVIAFPQLDVHLDSATKPAGREA